MDEECFLVLMGTVIVEDAYKCQLLNNSKAKFAKYLGFSMSFLEKHYLGNRCLEKVFEKKKLD